jgi:hypothetical protein
MLFFGKPKEEVSLMLDIGNGSVTGALVLFKQAKKPEFLYSTQVPFVVPKKPSATRLIEDIAPLLNTLLEDLVKYGFKSNYFKNKSKAPARALIAFSSPWFVSKTKHLEFSKDKPFVITEDFINSLVKEEEKIFKNEIQPLEASGGGQGNDFRIIDSSIVHTKINGYSLETSIGKKTKNLDAFLYMSMVSGNAINKIENSVLKYFHLHLNDIYIHTFPLVSFTVIRDLFSGSSSFLLIDVTAEVTDLTLVENDIIKHSVSIPSGKNFILRQIMKTFEVTAEVAESRLHLFTTEKLNTEDGQKMDNIFSDVEKEWSIYLENGLSELSPQFILPGNVYLTCDSDLENVYTNFLRLNKTDETSMFRKNIQINYINKESMSSFLNPSPGVKWNEFVAILAAFYNKQKGF